MATLVHLAGRFIGSIRPGAPSEADLAWVAGQLNEGEVALFERMSNPDKRHAVAVARDVVAELGEEATQPVVAAALLHDVGKVVSAYRTPARVAATVVWSVVDPASATAWLDRGRPWRRLAQYRLHPQLGEQLLTAAGSDPLTAHWAGDHHLPAEDWRVERAVAAALKACDDD